MPILEIATNVKVPDKRPPPRVGSARNHCPRHGQVLERHVQIQQGLIFGGTHEPAFYMTILTVLGLPTSNNAGYSKEFFAFIEKELGIPHDRGYIIFNNPGPDRLGHKSTTFDVLLKQMGK
ncbi:Tautomerase/MIF superfamily [Mucidula mucida]|nr:Tautomerase/MIF superfamily [Mucidula mucida]